MGFSRERRSMAAQSSPTPPRRRPSAVPHGSLCSHPYAPSASTTSPSPSYNDSRNGCYEPQLHHCQHLQHQQQPEEEVQQSWSRRGSDRASPFTVVDDSSTALQQQCETTRLLSRLLAGVTLQWRQVVEHLNDAQVPLTAEQLAAQRGSTTAAAAASPFALSGTIDHASNSTITYLQEGLHFDVQAHAQRRARERRQASQMDSPLREKREVAHPYYNDGRRSRSRAARQQLALYMNAEAAETEGKERREEEKLTAAAADWTALTPSAEWVPYVVGKKSTTNNKGSSRRRTKDVADVSDTFLEDRYDGVLYATPTPPLQRRCPSVRNGVPPRCAGCEAAVQQGKFDPDDESRLRNAVLYGMARSAETMILGMRQVKEVLPATAAAKVGSTASPVRAPSTHSRHTATSLPRRDRQQRTRSASPRRHRSPSPPSFPKRSHNSGRPADNTAQSGHVHVVCPAPPVAQRTQIYPKGETADRKVRGERGGGRRESVRRVSSPTKRTSDAPPQHQHRITVIPPQARTSSPALRGVTPVAAADRGTEARAPPNDASRSDAAVSSPAPVQRQLDWRGAPTTARTSSSNQVGGTKLRAALSADGDVPAAERAVTPKRVRRDRALAAVLPVADAARLLHGLRTTALQHAESEDRLQLALSHEKGTQALLQAHYHTLWKVHRGAAETSRRGQRHPLGQSGAAGSPLLASVSVSPISSPSMSPSASPIAAALTSVGSVEHHHHHQNSSSGSTVTATTSAPPSTVSHADTQSDIAFTVAHADVESVETIDLVCHSVAGGPRLSPTPPPRELLAPTADAADSPPPPSTPRASRSRPPPPPSPPVETGRPPTPALVSPLNDLPRNHEAPSLSISGKVAAEVRSSPSPAARHRGRRRHFIEDAPPTSICDRDALVALELFPENPVAPEEEERGVTAEEPLPVCDDAVPLPPPPPPTQQQQQSSSSSLLRLLSPPPPLPSAPLETREAVDNDDVVTAREVRRRSGTSDYQVSLNVQESATTRRRRKETRRTLVAPSVDVDGGTGFAAVLESVSTSPLPRVVELHSISPETAAAVVAQSWGSSGGGSASTSIRFDVESASPLVDQTASLVEEEDGEEVGEAVTTYSSVSSFRSALQDGLHSVEEAVLGTSAPALTSPHADSGAAAAALSDGAPVLDQTCLVDAENANQPEVAPSPPPRSPTP